MASSKVTRNSQVNLLKVVKAALALFYFLSAANKIGTFFCVVSVGQLIMLIRLIFIAEVNRNITFQDSGLFVAPSETELLMRQILKARTPL